MPGKVLTMASTVQCPHGGMAILITANVKIMVDNVPALLESDVHPVVGCLFTLPGPKPSPCIRIEWAGGSGQLKANGVGVLVQSSVGKCFSPESALQGVAIIAGTQVKVDAR
jgi:hypothetical protein